LSSGKQIGGQGIAGATSFESLPAGTAASIGRASAVIRLTMLAPNHVTCERFGRVKATVRLPRLTRVVTSHGDYKRYENLAAIFT
jgi:hypothetical protein